MQVVFDSVIMAIKLFIEEYFSFMPTTTIKVLQCETIATQKKHDFVMSYLNNY